jgi:TonB family protein
MKRATLTSFGLTIGLFTSAIVLGFLIASFRTTPNAPDTTIPKGTEPTVLKDFGLDELTNKTMVKIPISVFTTVFSGTKTVAGKFVGVVNDAEAIMTDDISTVENMGYSSHEKGDTDISDLEGLIDVVFGEEDEFEIDTRNIPAPQEEIFEQWEVTESPNVDISEISRNIIYPRIAKQAGIEGTVLLNVLIGPNGKITKLIVEHSDNLLLNEAAISAVKKSTYTPAIQNGKPCSCWMSIPIEFKLSN